MTTAPEPTDKLDAAANVAVNGPADDTLQLSERDRTVLRHQTLIDLHEPGAVKAARGFLGEAGHSNVAGLPDLRGSGRAGHFAAHRDVRMEHIGNSMPAEGGVIERDFRNCGKEKFAHASP